MGITAKPFGFPAAGPTQFTKMLFAVGAGEVRMGGQQPGSPRGGAKGFPQLGADLAGGAESGDGALSGGSDHASENLGAKTSSGESRQIPLPGAAVEIDGATHRGRSAG